MLKDSLTSLQTLRRTHRTYSAQFKVDLVAACLCPGASIAALALQHGMNANVLHRWLKEYELGRHRPGQASAAGMVQPSQPPAFIAIPLASTMASQASMPTQCATATADIRIESQRNGLCVTVSWPVSASGECAQMLREVLR